MSEEFRKWETIVSSEGPCQSGDGGEDTKECNHCREQNHAHDDGGSCFGARGLVKNLDDREAGRRAGGCFNISYTKEESDQEAERHDGVENDGPHHGMRYLRGSIVDFVTEMEDTVKS